MDDDQRSPFGLEDRIRAVAEAGYTGMGILHADLEEARKQPGGYGELRRMLTRHGITTVEIEWLDRWWTGWPAREKSDAIRAELLQAAKELGAHHIKAGGALDGSPVDWDTFVFEFRALCEQAEAHHTRIAYEPMPMDNVRTLARARQLIDEAGHPAGALLLDAWHIARGLAGYDEVEALDARYITAVELGDADREVVGTLVDDMWYRRRLCGEGVQDVTRFIQAVAATGYKGLWGIEVISEAWRRLPLLTQARRSYETTRAALDLAFPAAAAGADTHQARTA